MFKIKQFSYFLLLVSAIFFAACGSKSTEKAQKSTKEKGQNMVVDNDQESIQLNADAQIGNETGKWGPDSLKTIENYSLYREYYKQKLFTDAFPFWKYVITNAPEARKTPYIDGIKMYTKFAEDAADSLVKQSYIDTILNLYDQRISNFGEEGFLSGKKATIYKEFRPNEKETYYKLVNKCLDIEQEETPYQFILPYYNQRLKKYKSKELDKTQMEEVYTFLSGITEHNISNEHKKANMYEKVQEKLDLSFAQIMAPPKAVTCPEILAQYEPEYRANSNDLKTVKSVFGRLLRAKCSTAPLYKELVNKLYELEPTAARARKVAQDFYKAGDSQSAIKYYEEAAQLEQDRTQKSKIYMNMALIVRTSGPLTSASASQARKYAKQAAELQPGWGKPYLFIGDLYASSGKLCGPGTGWKSQVVTWAAVDMWSKAKNIDPSVAAEANKNINKYREFYPTTEEGFMRNIKNGDSFKLGCWIGTATTAKLRQ